VNRLPRQKHDWAWLHATHKTRIGLTTPAPYKNANRPDSSNLNLIITWAVISMFPFPRTSEFQISEKSFEFQISWYFLGKENQHVPHLTLVESCKKIHFTETTSCKRKLGGNCWEIIPTLPNGPRFWPTRTRDKLPKPSYPESVNYRLRVSIKAG
jgi:hypothetical protein